MERIGEKQKYIKRKINEGLIRVIPKIFLLVTKTFSIIIFSHFKGRMRSRIITTIGSISAYHNVTTFTAASKGEILNCLQKGENLLYTHPTDLKPLSKTHRGTSKFNSKFPGQVGTTVT